MISGLVVYLSGDSKLAEEAKQAISQQKTLEWGPLEERRLPLVLETATSSGSQEVTDWLNELPGVEHVDVAFVHLEEDLTTREPTHLNPTHLNPTNNDSQSRN